MQRLIAFFGGFCRLAAAPRHVISGHAAAAFHSFAHEHLGQHIDNAVKIHLMHSARGWQGKAVPNPLKHGGLGRLRQDRASAWARMPGRVVSHDHPQSAKKPAKGRWAGFVDLVQRAKAKIVMALGAKQFCLIAVGCSIFVLRGAEGSRQAAIVQKTGLAQFL